MPRIDRLQLIERRFLALSPASGEFWMSHAAIETASHVGYLIAPRMTQRGCAVTAVLGHKPQPPAQ